MSAIDETSLKNENSLSLQNLLTAVDEDKKEIADFLHNTVKLGKSSAHKCVEILFKHQIDSVDSYKMLTEDNLITIFKDAPIDENVLNKMVKYNDSTSTIVEIVLKDVENLEIFLENSGVDNVHKSMAANAFASAYLDSENLLKKAEKKMLVDCLVNNGGIPAVHAERIADLIGRKHSNETANRGAVATISDREEISNYLERNIPLTKSNADLYAATFIGARVDSVALMKSLSASELTTILSNVSGGNNAVRDLIVEHCQTSKRTGAKLTDEQRQQLMKDAIEEATNIMTKISQENEKLAAANKDSLDAVWNGVKDAANRADWKATTPSGDDIKNELNELESSKADFTTVTTGNYETYQEMANSMSDGALRKAVRFINGPGFGSRGACALFDFVESAKKYKDIQVMHNPKLDYTDVVCYSSKAQSSFESMQKSATVSNSYNIKIAAHYAGYGGAVTSSGGIATDRKSSKSSIHKTSSYTSYKTTSTFVTMNSFQVNLSKTCLDTMAISDFQKINSEAQAETFLMNYGTHVLLTPQLSGGVFNSTIQISFFSETSETEKMKAVADSVTIRGGVSVSGPQVGVSGAVEHSTSKVDASKSSHSTTTETYSTQHHIKTIGPQVLEFVAFHNALTHNNKAHCLVSNGFDMGDPTTWANKSIWEIALEAPELSQFAGRFKVAQLLRNAWLKMVLESSGPHLETFMSTMVSQTLNHNIRDNALEVDIDTEKWAEPWRIKLGIRQVTDESDPFTVPVNVWCVLASDLGTVLDIPYGEARDGSRLWMQNLNDRPSQYWKFTPEGYIENFLGNVVIQIGEKDSLTLRHKTEEEDKNSAQKFYFNNLRQLVTHVDSQLCIDVKGANSAGGATVFCSKPHNGSNQKWRFFPVDPTPYPQALSVWCHITSDKGNVKFDLNYDGGTSKRRSFQFTHTANDKIWKLNPDGSIESELEKDVGGVSQELVLDVKNGNVAEGAWLYPKNHSGAQKWFFTIDKELVPYADTTTCLEWFRDDSNKKVTCFFSKRSGSPKQRWEFSPCAPALMATK